MYASETSKHRDKIAPFCTGYGLDIGFGGDPVVPTAIRLDLPRQNQHHPGPSRIGCTG